VSIPEQDTAGSLKGTVEKDNGTAVEQLPAETETPSMAETNTALSGKIMASLSDRDNSSSDPQKSQVHEAQQSGQEQTGSRDLEPGDRLNDTGMREDDVATERSPANMETPSKVELSTTLPDTT
jgi:hypothetical protein